MILITNKEYKLSERFVSLLEKVFDNSELMNFGLDYKILKNIFIENLSLIDVIKKNIRDIKLLVNKGEKNSKSSS